MDNAAANDSPNSALIIRPHHVQLVSNYPPESGELRVQQLRSQELIVLQENRPTLVCGGRPLNNTFDGGTTAHGIEETNHAKMYRLQARATAGQGNPLDAIRVNTGPVNSGHIYETVVVDEFDRHGFHATGGFEKFIINGTRTQNCDERHL